MANQVVTLKAAGLHTYFQSLMEIPPGALLKADNTVINRDGVIEPRRGIKAYGASFGTSSSRAKQLIEYKGRIIRHIDDTLSYDDGSGVFTNFSGSYLEPISGFRIKSQEAKSNLYFTTSEGVKKISATSADDFSIANIIQDAGAPKAITGTVRVNHAVSGFLTANNQVAYKILWSYTDRNSNLLLGSPSARMVAYNQSTSGNASVDITFQIPYNVDSSDYKYRIYRSEMALTDPSDELYLVYEGTPTTAELSAGSITYTDSLSEDLRLGGVPLYTNQYSGEGALQANEPPPSARDIALFKGHMFYANTRSKHFATFNLLSTTGFTSGSSDLVITDGTTTTTYTFRGTKEKTNVTVTLAKAAIVASSYFLASSASNERQYKVWMDKTGTDPEPSVPGTIPIRVNLSSGAIVTATDVAVAIKNQMNATAGFDFTVTNLGAVLTIENTNNGNCSNGILEGVVDVNTTFTFSTITQGTGEDANNRYILISAKTNQDDAIEEMAKSIVQIINAQSSEIVSAYYISSQDDTPGQILLQRKTLEDKNFYVGTSDSAIASKFNPEIGLDFSNTAVSVANPTKITTSANHGLAVNNYVFIYNANTTNSINGYQKVTIVPALNEYNIAVNVSSVTSNGRTMTTKMRSKTDTVGNRLYWSKFQEHEAVPLLFYADIGARDQEIRRIVALRESLFILKGDGVFRLAGDGGPSPVWDIAVFDNTSIIKAPDTAVTLGNNAYFFGNQGIVKLNESTLETISRPIEDKLLPFISTNSNLASASFSVGYESDRALLVWTVKNKTDSVATVCYRYNYLTNCWTEWRISKTCAVLNVPQDKLYFGSGIDNYIEVERKNFDRFDYADRELPQTLSTSGLAGSVIKVSDFASVAEEDVLLQTQYVTITQFNNLLKKLDLDNGLVVHSFYDDLAMVSGDSLSSKMSLLVAKLNIADPSTVYVFSGSTVFSTIQTEFNTIISQLNASSYTYFSNYQQSTGTHTYEAIVISLDSISKEITLNASPSFMTGPLTLYKGVKVDVEYAPQHAGDPASHKQFSVGTFMFERRSFYTAHAWYNSDISDNYEKISFIPNSSSIFGGANWGEGTFGGLGDQSQIRTYIPLKKQRCRFIGCKFTHGVALETFELYGLALSVRGYAIPDRDYR